jgi:hypothetical protein
MRGLMVVILLLSAAVATDLLVFDGRNSAATWQLAKYEGYKFSRQARDWAKSILP